MKSNTGLRHFSWKLTFSSLEKNSEINKFATKSFLDCRWESTLNGRLKKARLAWVAWRLREDENGQDCKASKKAVKVKQTLEKCS